MRKRYGGRSTAYRALALARTLARQQEVKVLTVQSATIDVYPAGTAGAIYPLNNIGQGDAINQRQGNKVTLKRVDFNMRCACLHDSNTTYRVIIFQDLQQRDSTAPTITDVVTQTNTLSTYNVLYTQRFRILYDQRRTLNASFLNGDNADQFAVSIRRFAQGGLSEFSAAGAATQSKNGLWMIVFCDVAAAGDVTTAVGAAGSAQYKYSALTYYAD